MKLHLRIILFWILLGVLLGICVYFAFFEKYSQRKTIELFIYVGALAGAIISIIHSLWVAVVGRDTILKNSLPALGLLAIMIGATYSEPITELSCNISEPDSLEKAREYTDVRGYDVNALNARGSRIKGCSYAFEYSKGDEWHMVIVNRDGKVEAD